MLLTVAICTHNSARLLAKSLSSFTDLLEPEGCRWELVVVANACCVRGRGLRTGVPLTSAGS
jgi:glycosyltransferase involved in cell wall biosynthesis